MLTPYSKSRFLSKVFTDAIGRKFRLTFLVAVIDGELRGHLISVEPISSSVSVAYQLEGSVSSEAFCLPIICSEKKPDTKYVSPFISVISPYFSLEFLINSQPTRAPSSK